MTYARSAGRRAAVHEAGHAIAAQLLGCRVASVSITHVSYAPPEDANGAVAVIAAGMAAELVVLGDYDEFRAVYDIGRLARIARTCWGSSVTIRAALDREVDRTAELLRSHVALLTAVEVALLRHGALSAARFARIAAGVSKGGGTRGRTRAAARPPIMLAAVADAVEDAPLTNAALADLTAGLEVLEAWAIARGDSAMLARVDRWARERLSGEEARWVF